ncbi:hypothetical protein OnM2_096021 [Erysiphe neolycopersici]|uniref:Uncharacterized protein n=1 Tax=Erysiphe neolycopersici TaxID=212602 RepID=A0A420HB40_9PEZI|nr:hypothetical protein OnM2_096021 [Erysiphe neolycopersici]
MTPTKDTFITSFACFACTSSWEQDWEKAKQNKNLVNIKFQEDFRIVDEHIDAIATSTIAENLKKLQFGDSDTGIGRCVTDQAIVRLAQRCLKLEEVLFYSATSLTDTALLAIAQNCSLIRSINISGNDKIHGRVTGNCFDQLVTNPDIAPRLMKIILLDQNVKHKKIKLLTKQRPSLIICEGDTVGNGIAAQMVASMTGAGNTTEWRNGKMISMTSEYGMGHISFDEFDEIDDSDGLSLNSSDYDSEENYDKDFGEDEEQKDKEVKKEEKI